jgi:hypothetical protein
MGRQRRDHETASVTRASAERERRPDLRQGGMRAAGVAASRVAAPIVARRGGGVLFRLKAEWTVVVGAELAAATWPEALGRDGALKLRVRSSVALDLQHRAPLVIERVNRYFGRDAVARLVLVQGPLPLAAPPAAAAPTPLAPEEASALDLRLGDISDPELRAALARLGRLVLAGGRRGD